jgi:hypothetical protein
VSGQYDRIAASYGPLADVLEGLSTRVDDLASTVGRIDRSSAALPARVAVPRSVRASAPASRPATHATTGASGAP